MAPKRRALSDTIGSQTVRCSIGEQDRYGRRVAQCSVGGTDLGERMVEVGWARDWRRYSGGRYADEEARARSGAGGSGDWNARGFGAIGIMISPGRRLRRLQRRRR
ncbi:thermonuclease family protein [Vitreimonas sp.]|uniref:thermonuclease family protein n=1 Tax=Vitreimonas sp. TaxID=3069702 RepID=UPI0032C22BF2